MYKLKKQLYKMLIQPN